MGSIAIFGASLAQQKEDCSSICHRVGCSVRLPAYHPTYCRDFVEGGEVSSTVCILHWNGFISGSAKKTFLFYPPSQKLGISSVCTQPSQFESSLPWCCTAHNCSMQLQCRPSHPHNNRVKKYTRKNTYYIFFLISC